VSDVLLPPRLDDQLCYAIYSANIAINRAYRPALEALGLTYPQYLVLNALVEIGDQTIGAIGERLALESSTVTPLVKRMESAGLVKRERNRDDERQVIVSLSADGKARQARSGLLTETLMRQLDMTAEDAAHLVQSVRQLQRRLSIRIAQERSGLNDVDVQEGPVDV
jgi:DNA-binding MarR family transcriptional regulator